MAYEDTVRALVAQLTLEEKASLLSGMDFWHTKAIQRLNIPAVAVSDGPHGLRKVREDAKEGNINAAVPATCFPPACTTACSFDPQLLSQMGAAIGEEARANGVNVVLGPGVNIKRSPLCGRNFEYFSEDPLLAGSMATAFIQGVQSTGCGTSVKHFALNNQETRRMKTDSVVDERALHEIYLPAFEQAIRYGKPHAVMCAYNRVFGEYASDSRRLLTDILRVEWGFDGLVISDWGATNDRIAGAIAGLDLEMPPQNGYENDKKLVAAVRTGALDESIIDTAAQNVITLALRYRDTQPQDFDVDAHHELARRIAGESAVLLKNDGSLPLTGEPIAVLGAFAKHSRYQGSGSSKINPTRIDSAYASLAGAGIPMSYAPGYRMDCDAPDAVLIDQAVALAAQAPAAVIFAGLPDSFESEGFDRQSMAMPQAHIKLIDAVCKVNNNVTVVLYGGSPMELPFAGRVSAILLCYLPGQAGGRAVCDLLTGSVNPSGRLAESWPLELSHTPCHAYFPGKGQSVEYRESIFVGYRYYLSADKPVRYPFGHGLSYTTFEYSAIRLNDTFKKDGRVIVSFSVKNTGNRAGSEVVQLYVNKRDPVMFRPALTLRGFKKLALAPGEQGLAEFVLTEHDFAYYDTQDAAWRLESGEYIICAGASCVDIRQTSRLSLPGSPGRKGPQAYYDLSGGISISDADFERMLGRPIPPAQLPPDAPITLNSSLSETAHLPAGRRLLWLLKKIAPIAMGNSADVRIMTQEALPDMPLRALSVMSGGILSFTLMQKLVNRLEKQNKKSFHRNDI
ncbi:MAG: beta-glucosidase [Clostridia bacterium]